VEKPSIRLSISDRQPEALVEQDVEAFAFDVGEMTASGPTCAAGEAQLASETEHESSTGTHLVAAEA
jgi:hypothetical protein